MGTEGLVGKAGRSPYGGALIAVTLGVAGGKDEPLVAIEFAKQGMGHEVVAKFLGIGRCDGEFDGALAGGAVQQS
jgi:hypothetical protein